MERGIYTAASGMVAAQQWMDVTAHNLANASTTGYKRDAAIFDEAFERAMNADGGLGEYLGSVGTGPILKGQYTSFEVGIPMTTGNDLDVAITTKEGLFSVEGPDGSAYTRDGSFALNEDRELITHSGYRVLDPNGSPIKVPVGTLDVSPDGSISVDGNSIGKIGIYDGQFTKVGHGLFSGTNVTSLNSGSLTSPMLTHRAVESSNVNAIEEMISMIKINRVFEMAQKSITSEDEMSQKLIQSLQSQ